MPGSPEPDINLTTKPIDREEQHVQGAEDDQGLCKNMVIEKNEERLSDEVKVRKRGREREMCKGPSESDHGAGGLLFHDGSEAI